MTLNVLERTSITERLSMRLLEHSRLSAALVEAQSNTSRATLAQELLHVEEGAQYAASLVVLGGDVVDEVAGESFTLGPLSIESREGKLFLDDGCIWLAEGTDRHAECQVVDGGAMTNGVYRAVQTIIRDGRAIRSAMPVPDLEAGYNANFSRNPQVRRAVEEAQSLAVPWVRDAISSVAFTLDVESQRRIESRLQTHDAAIGTFLAVVAALVLWQYWNYFDQLAAPISAAWQLLAVVPAAVRDGIPDMKTGIRDLITDEQLAG
jgi:predicted butyrate kinase (DUF1464 family)